MPRLTARTRGARRQQLLSAARRCFTRNGFQATSMPDLTTAAVLPDLRTERRRRLAEPDLEFQAFCTPRRVPASSTRNWSGLGRLAGRALPARRDQPTARLHRQAVPAR